ncbi:MAG TPA: acyltransferase, partial [Candidatus Hydrogenedentes bacterium]|nr:acyltransferase [Candidatus Hydrogenedentota bacterium]
AARGMLDALPWGSVGVQFFLVLSGYLVTTILLDCRDRIDDGGGQTFAFALRQFHARRALRVLPLYYGVLAVLVVLDYGMIRESLHWHALCLMNFWRSATGINFLNHLWVIAVEQQFYLAWPFLILLVPRARRVPVILVLMAVAPVYRFSAWYLGAPFVALNTIPLASLDTLGIGALLALFQRESDGYRALRHFLLRIAPWMGAAGLCALAYGRLTGRLGGSAQGVALGSLLAPLYAALVAGAARGLGGPARRLLEARPVRYVGIISYGVYVLHPLVMELCLHAHAAWGMSYPRTFAFRLVLVFALSVLAASVTWYALEKPLNALKRRFPYAARGDDTRE